MTGIGLVKRKKEKKKSLFLIQKRIENRAASLPNSSHGYIEMLIVFLFIVFFFLLLFFV